MLTKELAFDYSKPSENYPYTYLRGYLGKREVGYLMFRQEDDGVWDIADMSSSVSGVGKALVAKFSADVAGYSPVTATVTEIETLERLRELGHFAEAQRALGELVLDEQESYDTLARLKFWHVLHGGGLTDIRFILLNTGEPLDPNANGDTPWFYRQTVSVSIEARTP